MEKQKAIVYVDGFNFYYGLKQISMKDKSWKKFYWLDMVYFFEQMLGNKYELLYVNYFSARPYNTEAADRQDLLFSANKLNPKFKLILGKYIKKEIKCLHCKNIIHSYEEKETDVRIATQMINDAYRNNCDITVIVSADSDMLPAIELIRQINHNHNIFVYFPPLRYSVSLSSSCDGERKLGNMKARFNQSQLAERIVLPNGKELYRPNNWQ